MLCISIDNAQQIQYISQQILYFHATIYAKNIHNPNSPQFEALFQHQNAKSRIQGFSYQWLKSSVISSHQQTNFLHFGMYDSIYIFVFSCCSIINTLVQCKFIVN